MMNILRLLLFPFLGNMRKAKPAAPTPQRPAHPPLPSANANHLHIFLGTFPSESEATQDCLMATGSLARDLPDARIDTAEAEVIFGRSRIDAALPMLTGPLATLKDQLSGHNTMILIPDAAIGGSSDTLENTAHLHYVGGFDVR